MDDDEFTHIVGFSLLALICSVLAGAYSCVAEGRAMCYVCRKQPCDGVRVLAEDGAHYYLCRKCAMKIRNEHSPKETDQ